MLDEPWAALSGVSGAALACCFVAAALALRWSSRRTARASAVRARQRQKAALDTMDKAAQRFRLQVTAGVGIGVEGEGSGWQQRFEPPGRSEGWAAGSSGVWEGRAAGSSSVWEGRAAGSSGVWAAQVCNFLTPLSPSCILYSFLNQVGPRGGMETKGTGQVVEGCRLTGSKRSFAVWQIISRSRTY